jgi:hypothetical protein
VAEGLQLQPASQLLPCTVTMAEQQRFTIVLVLRAILFFFVHVQEQEKGKKCFLSS